FTSRHINNLIVDAHIESEERSISGRTPFNFKRKENKVGTGAQCITDDFKLPHNFIPFAEANKRRQNIRFVFFMHLSRIGRARSGDGKHRVEAQSLTPFYTTFDTYVEGSLLFAWKDKIRR